MNRSKNKYKIIFAVLLTMLTSSCIETFEATFEDFESAVVIEATLTNIMEQQTVFITRTFEFEEDGPSAEANANVQIVGGGNTYLFQENEPGLYVSEQAFAAQPNTTYQLLVTTQDGRSYSSDEQAFTTTTQIDNVRAERITNDDGEDGVAILVDSFDASGNSLNYRYEYEETFKIIAPFWSPLTLERTPLDVATQICEVSVVPDDKSEETCFASDFSNAIIQTSTLDLAEDRVDNFMVRFISRDDYIISHRYSILVRQYVQSNSAFTFYETLNEFSGSESLFSETQPGFLEGNISSDSSDDEKVLGFFDVASVVERRIFFNYEDLFPGEPLPPYIDPCELSSPVLSTPGMPPKCVLAVQTDLNIVSYAGNNDSSNQNEGPFYVVPVVCGDCQEIGKVQPPDFWIE